MQRRSGPRSSTPRSPLSPSIIAIVRRLVELHGGHLHAASRYGFGTLVESFFAAPGAVVRYVLLLMTI